MSRRAYLTKGVLLCLVLIGLTSALLAYNWEDFVFFGPTTTEVKPPFSCPNPFTEGSWVCFVFDAGIEGQVEVSIYTVSGLLVAKESNPFTDIVGTASDGKPDFAMWSGLNFAGRSVAPGAYIWLVTITDTTTKKVEVHKGICFKM